MNLSDLLGTSFDCKCGKKHTIPTRKVVYSGQTLRQLPALLEQYCLDAAAKPGTRLVNLVADERTYPLAGQSCTASLKQAGWRVTERILPDGMHGGPVCDDTTRDFLSARLPPADCFLAVGSGTVSDLVKWLACDLKRPYAVFATAASMNGYASNNMT